MIVDILNEVYTKLKTDVTGCTVLQSYPSTDPVFPCAIIQSGTDSNNTSTHDSAGDHHSDGSFEINIFANGNNKVSKVKDIRNQIDTIMSGTYNMNRDESVEVANFVDSSIYRWVVRYSFTIDANKRIYRR